MRTKTDKMKAVWITPNSHCALARLVGIEPTAHCLEVSCPHHSKHCLAAYSIHPAISILALLVMVIIDYYT